MSSGITIKPSNFENDSILKLLTSTSAYIQFQLAADSSAFTVKNNSVDILDVDQGLFNVNVDTKVQNLFIEDEILNR